MRQREHALHHRLRHQLGAATTAARTIEDYASASTVSDTVSCTGGGATLNDASQGSLDIWLLVGDAS